MAYYNPYINPYQAAMQPPQPVQPVSQQNVPQTGAGICWVQGEAGARSWLSAPNSTVLLMDSEAERFYIKTTDASGMPLPLRVFDFKERTNADPHRNTVQAGSEYVTREEFEAFRDELLNGRPGKRGGNESDS